MTLELNCENVLPKLLKWHKLFLFHTLYREGNFCRTITEDDFLHFTILFRILQSHFNKKYFMEFFGLFDKSGYKSSAAIAQAFSCFQEKVASCQICDKFPLANVQLANVQLASVWMANVHHQMSDQQMSAGKFPLANIRLPNV